MVLRGNIQYQGDGLTISTRAMVTQLEVLNVHTDNIANFGVPGYQRKEPVITSFVEHLGVEGLDTATNTEIGRIRLTGHPLDLALNTKGYFQKVNAFGAVEMTRDGRFEVDKDGYVRALDGKQVLSASGTPLKLDVIPDDLKAHLKIAPDGTIEVYDTKAGKMVSFDQIGVANQDGSPVSKVDVKQGYVEDSNVMLQKEYVSIMPLRRQFEANRQLFILQSDLLSRMVQELGRAQ